MIVDAMSSFGVPIDMQSYHIWLQVVTKIFKEWPVLVVL